MAIRVLVLGEPTEGRDALQAALWLDGRDVLFTERSGLRTALAAEPPDVVIVGHQLRGDAVLARWLADDAPGVPALADGSIPDILRALHEPHPPRTELVLADAHVDLAGRQVRREDTTTSLTPTEVNLLRFLAAHASRLVPVDELRKKVWAYAEGVQSRAVENTIYRLRRKIEADPKKPRALISTYGAGYRLVLSTPVAPSAERALPALRDPFVGRHSDVDGVLDALARTRLVSLLGPGGVGKSRLALEVAHRVGDTAVWVDLTSVESGGFGDVVAARLSVRAGAAGLTRSLVHRGPILLVLDNCEHLIEEVADLVSTWLDEVPELALLATSREPLAVRGEHRWSVGPLPLPETGEVGAVKESEAACLFEVRASSRVAGFSITEHNVADVAAIVRLVDGLPLALELAASAVASTSLARLAQGLAQSIDSIVADERDRPSRHRSVRAALDWSWARLDDALQRAVTLLSAFAGPFSVEAAEAVLGPSQRGVQRALVDMSWLRRVSDDRFGMLSLLRRYVATRAPERTLAEAHHRHGEYFRTADVSVEAIDDLVVAAWHAIDARRVEAGLDLVERAARMSQRVGAYPTTIRLCEALMALEPPAAVLSRAHRLAGVAHERLGDMDATLAHYEAARAAAERSGDERLIARSQGAFGSYFVRTGDRTRAAEVEAASLKRGRELGDPEIVAIASANLGYLRGLSGAYEEAAELYQRSIELYESIGDEGGACGTISKLGLLHAVHGYLPEAQRVLERAIDMAGRIGARGSEAMGLGNLANLLHEQGKSRQAIAIAERSVAIRREEGDRRSEGVQLGNLGDFHLSLGELDVARDYLERALEVARLVSDVPLEGTWLGKLGTLHTRSGRYSASRRCFETGEALLAVPGREWYLGYLLAAWVELEVDVADLDSAHEVMQRASALAASIGTRSESSLGRALQAARNRIPQG